MNVLGPGLEEDSNVTRAAEGEKSHRQQDVELLVTKERLLGHMAGAGGQVIQII